MQRSRVITAMFVVAILPAQLLGQGGPAGAQLRLDVPASIDRTGVEDVTEELQRWLNQVPDSSVIVFPANGRYRVEGTLLLEDRWNLTFEGNGSTFFASTNGSDVPPPTRLSKGWPRRRGQWWFFGGGGITFRQVIVRGAHVNAGTARDAYVEELEGQHAFHFRGVDEVELDRVEVYDVFGDFVYLGGNSRGGELVWTRRVHIHDSRFERNGRQGFAITAAEDVLIERNQIRDVRRTAIDIEPNGNRGGARQLTIRDNDFGAIGNHFLAGHGKIGTVDDITVEGNRLHGARMRISSNRNGNRRRNWRIVDNVSDRVVGMPIPVITLHRIDGLVVKGNEQPLAKEREMTGILVTQSCGVEIEGNQFAGAVREYSIEAPQCMD